MAGVQQSANRYIGVSLRHHSMQDHARGPQARVDDKTL